MIGVTAWYIRHGHNPANQTAELSHKVTDYPLTGLGVTQATTLAGQLARYPAPAAIYSSPLRRAVQTAEIIASRTGGTVQVIEELRELDVGELDGRRDEQAWAAYRHVLEDWQAGRHETAFPGGENYQQMTKRLADAFRYALRHPEGSRVLFIGHGGIIRATIPALCPGTPVAATDLPNCGVAELNLRPAPEGITTTLSHWPFPIAGQGPRI